MARQSRRAAIPDDLLDKPLAEISAADLVKALSASQQPQLGVILADKKKYELWVEENPVDRIPLRELLDKLRGEKKKVELELPFDIGQIVNPPLLDRLAEAVAKRLGR